MTRPIDQTPSNHVVRPDTSHDEWLAVQLQDPEFVADFLIVASEDDDPSTYLTALRNVADAQLP